MGVTVSAMRKTVEGDRAVRYFTLTFDASYPTGGEALTDTDMGLRGCDFFMSELMSANGKQVVWDRTNDKALIFDGGAEVSNGTDQSAVVIRCKAVGRGR
jgi:hypothetical protein